MIVNSQDFMLVPGSNRSIAAIALVSVSCTRSSALVLSRQKILAKPRSAGMRLTISESDRSWAGLPAREGPGMLTVPFRELRNKAYFDTTQKTERHDQGMVPAPYLGARIRPCQ